jgi:hypothetical protein
MPNSKWLPPAQANPLLATKRANNLYVNLVKMMLDHLAETANRLAWQQNMFMINAEAYGTQVYNSCPGHGPLLA